MTGSIHAPMVSRRLRLFFYAVIIVAILLRFGLCIYLQDLVPANDPRNNVELARSVIEGRGLTTNSGIYGANIRAQYPPGYPLLLAGFASVLGLNLVTITIINTAIDLAVAALMIQLGKVARQPGAFLAAAAYLLWPMLILSAPVAQKEGLVTLFTMQLMLAFAWLWRGDRIGWAWIIWTGICAGLLTLTQPSLIGLPLCLGLVMLGRTRLRTLVSAGIPAAAVAVMILLPWWIRNWQLFHQFVPLTTTAGHSLMVVLNDGHLPLPANVAVLDEPARSKAMGAIAMHRIAADPAAYLVAVAKDVVIAWGKGSFAHERLIRYSSRVLVPWAILNAAQLAFTLYAAWRRPNRLLLTLLAGSILWMVLFAIWFEFSERHRQFMLPIFWLLSAPIMLGLIRKRAPTAADSTI